MKVGYKYTYNGMEHAVRMYAKDPKIPTLQLDIEFDTGSLQHEITVSEAEQLATDLMEYVNEIKEAAENDR